MRRTGVVLLAVTGLAGCSVKGEGTIIDAAVFPDTAVDAPYAPDFTCAQVPWPTTAPDPLALGGRVLSPATLLPVGDVTVAMHKVSDGSLLGQSTSTDGGAFAGTYSIAAVTGGTALATYRKATRDGRVDAYSYDPFAVYNGPTGGLTAYSPTQAEIDAYYLAAAITNDVAKGTLLIATVDCQGIPLAEASVTVPGAALVLYLNDQLVVELARTRTSRAGIAIALGVPAGVVDVAVQDNTVARVRFRTWPVTSFANSFTSSLRYP